MTTSIIELVAALAARGIELQADGSRLRFRPKSALAPELAERVSRHKSELLELLAGHAETVTDERPETRVDQTWRRFRAVVRPWPDGRGWFDPKELERFGRLTERPVARPATTQTPATEETAVQRAARYRAAWKRDGYPPGVRPDETSDRV